MRTLFEHQHKSRFLITHFSVSTNCTIINYELNLTSTSASPISVEPSMSRFSTENSCKQSTPMYVLTLDAVAFLIVPPAPSSIKNKSASASIYLSHHQDRYHNIYRTVWKYRMIVKSYNTR